MRASIASHTNSNFGSYLDGTWALRPLELVRERGQTMLVVDYTGGRAPRSPYRPAHGDRAISPIRSGPVCRTPSAPWTRAHSQGHQASQRSCRSATGTSGSPDSASRRDSRASASRPTSEFIAGTLAYMAPEQTGRVNRSIDSRSDLYSLGVTFYEMLTGSLPFTASDPMEWVHCHIARQPAAPSERLTEYAGGGLRDHDEAALEDGRGTVSDGGRSGKRSTALPLPMGVTGAPSTISLLALMTFRIAS